MPTSHLQRSSLLSRAFIPRLPYSPATDQPPGRQAPTSVGRKRPTWRGKTDKLFTSPQVTARCLPLSVSAKDRCCRSRLLSVGGLTAGFNKALPPQTESDFPRGRGGWLLKEARRQGIWRPHWGLQRTMANPMAAFIFSKRKFREKALPLIESIMRSAWAALP